MTRIANPHASIEQMTNEYLKVGSSRAATGENGLSFEEILSGKASESDEFFSDARVAGVPDINYEFEASAFPHAASTSPRR